MQVFIVVYYGVLSVTIHCVHYEA